MLTVFISWGESMIYFSTISLNYLYKEKVLKIAYKPYKTYYHKYFKICISSKLLKCIKMVELCF